MAKRFKSLDELREYLKTHDKVFYWEKDNRFDVSKLGTPDCDPYLNLGYWAYDFNIEWDSFGNRSGHRIGFKRNDSVLPNRELLQYWVFSSKPTNIKMGFYDDIPTHFDGWFAFENTSELEYARLTGSVNNKLKIVYSGTNSDSVSDFDATKWVDNKIEEYLNIRPIDFEIRVGTEYMLNVFALRVMEGIIPMEDIEFYFEDTLLVFDKYDGIEFPNKNPPSNWAMWATVNEQILLLGYERMKKDEKNKEET